MKNDNITAGSRIRYNDGRCGHDVGATVINANDHQMMVQFDDRADTTIIRFNDRDWMDYLTVEGVETATETE